MKNDPQTRELVEYAVGASLTNTPDATWAAIILEPMKKLNSFEEKAEFLANFATNAINTLRCIVERAAAEQQLDPLQYWASHCKLTAEISGEDAA